MEPSRPPRNSNRWQRGLNRCLTALGRTLVALGAIVLLFSAFQLWGTGLSEAQAQRELAARLAMERGSALGGQKVESHPDSRTDEEQLANIEAAAVITETPENTAEDDRSILVIQTTPPATDGSSQKTPLAAPLPPTSPAPPAEGEPIAMLKIPSIEVEKTVVFGTGRDALRDGPGLYPSTVRPGWAGNSAIAGHRTTYGAPFFRIDELVPGDEIFVETADGRFTYRVQGHSDAEGQIKGHQIVAPDAVEVLTDYGDNRLTLTACHPLYSAKERIVVWAELVGEPYDPTPPVAPVEIAAPARTAPSPAPPDGNSGGDDNDVNDKNNNGQTVVSIPEPILGADENSGELGWQFEYLKPSLWWAAATSAIVLISWLLARYWRPWPTYAVAVPPFAMALFSFFVELDRLLPLG